MTYSRNRVIHKGNMKSKVRFGTSPKENFWIINFVDLTWNISITVINNHSDGPIYHWNEYHERYPFPQTWITKPKILSSTVPFWRFYRRCSSCWENVFYVKPAQKKYMLYLLRLVRSRRVFPKVCDYRKEWISIYSLLLLNSTDKGQILW